MEFKYRKLPETPADLNESEVRICSSEFEKLTGYSASTNRLKPWKGRVVALTSPEGTIYRVAKGHGNLPIPAGFCWVGPRTRSQLGIGHNSDIQITPMPNQWWARFLYYNNHLDDAVRFTFRIGFWGLIFGVVSLGLSLRSLLLPLVSNFKS
jgi:hypothetical protein